MAKHNYIFQIELDMEDYKILVEYGYDFETNFKKSAEEVARQLRYYEEEGKDEDEDE